MNEFISTELLKKIESDEKTISARLKTLRTRVGIEIDDFAEALAVDEAELVAYENGTQEVPASVIALVCALSGVSYEYFFDEVCDEDALDDIITGTVQRIAVEEQAAVLN